ncbi:MAG TPA: RHS repeat-associated core domain-containing protein [Thermoanaerobaculia bacterium]|nr:RHS repeat-associated core domain-containing protein [Thermoanaerobaculia bacterium]
MRKLFSVAAVLAVFTCPAAAQVRTCGTTSLGTYHWIASGQLARTNNCQGTSGFRCYAAENTAWFVEKTSPACNPNSGSCAVRIHATATIPGLKAMITEEGSLFSSLTPWAEWYPCTGASCTKDFACGLAAFGGQIDFDNLDTWLERGLSCEQAWATNLSVYIRVCAGSACEDPNKNRLIDIPATGLALGLGCPLRLPSACTEGSGGSSGAAGLSCPLCQPVGGESGCSVPVAGGGPSCAPDWLGKAQLRYAAGGVGGDGLPGSVSWRTALGRFWSHDHAERIVLDPDTSHVWLLTRHGSFREFSNLAAGTGLRLYQNRAPSDEFRKLYFDTATNGWQLHSLDGRRDFFHADGRWDKTTFASDPANPVQGTWNGSNQLVSVSFPDGRSDTLAYHPGGKLASITENPVAGSGTPSRTWSFTWTGDNLTLATRPDGTAWQFFYDASRPGYLTRMDLVSGPLGRVTAAFEYQAGSNNVARSWRGDPAFAGPNAIEKITYGYINPSLPTETVVTREVSGTFDQVTTYDLARDPLSGKPKVTSIQGSCPTCGLSPTTTFAYAGSNPLLPSSTTDAKGTRTDYTYNANGRLLTRAEAASVPSLVRTTTYIYDANFPGLVTRMEVPSISGGTNKRRTDSVFDPTTGVMTTRTIDGFEGGAALPTGFKTTAYTYNGSGEILTLDPPGFGTADATTFTYNLTGRNGHLADTRTDPLVGTTAFAYDGLNRRTSMTDPNGVETVTSYDSLNRVIEVRQEGATPAEDLVTTYTYTPFGDLFCTKLPRGNGLEYAYDEAGRLTEVLRGTAVTAPDSTTCLDVSQPRERTAYQLDGSGNRIEESLERWTGSTWESRSKTAYEYTCHLDKMTQGAGSATPSVTEYCYDLNDNLEKVWDANHPRATNPNPTQLYAYDALNRLTSTTVGVATTSYTYDVQDHLKTVTDAEGNLTTYTYSDRDLLTQQVSPVSGTASHTYNEHGELVTTTDARTVVTTRSVDVLDRVTAVSYSDGTPGTSYAYDTGPFGKERLSSITQAGHTIEYGYDRFGRLIQDGALTYAYDANGNRSRMTYPNNVAAVYTHDFADREATLSYEQSGGAQPPPIVTSAIYEPFGPLASLNLGNGLTETRLFDARYFPDRIQVPGLLDWDYTLDAVGNPLQISDLLTSQNRTYGYLDPQYFLTQGDGPWGTRSWTYDRIGNRLTETRGGQTDTYGYTGGNPKLQTITLPGGAGTKYFAYDAAGNQVQDSRPDNEYQLTYDAAGRLTRLGEIATDTATRLLYDGRGFLRESRQDLSVCSPLLTQPTYTSEGVLVHHAQRNALAPVAPPLEEEYILYFSGRPVAIFKGNIPAALARTYLTTDHLGTPVLATSGAGAHLWDGGFEPFGADWNGAQGAGVFLRFPGQWEDVTWENARLRAGLYYNVHRWLDSERGRYTRPDPLGMGARIVNLFAYVMSNPLTGTDVLGLIRFEGFNPQQQSEAEQAIRQIRNALEQRPCCAGSDGRAMDWLSYIDDPDFTIVLDQDLQDCGRTPFGTMIGVKKTIKVSPAAWNCCPGGRQGINSLASTILHEVGHAAGQSPRHPWDVEQRCFGCNPTVGEQ